MKCPQCIKKPSELQTKRTLANGRTVRRERYCPKCKGTFFTIESLEPDLLEQMNKHREQVRDLTDRTTQAENELLDLKDHLTGVMEICGFRPAKK